MQKLRKKQNYEDMMCVVGVTGGGGDSSIWASQIGCGFRGSPSLNSVSFLPLSWHCIPGVIARGGSSTEVFIYFIIFSKKMLTN